MNSYYVCVKHFAPYENLDRRINPALMPYQATRGGEKSFSEQEEILLKER